MKYVRSAGLVFLCMGCSSSGNPVSPGEPNASPDAAQAVESSDGDASAPDAAAMEAGLTEAQPTDVAATDAEAQVADGTSLDSSPEAAVCERHFPPCPATPPSYQNDVVPIVKFECLGCHYAGSSLTRTAYETYQGVYSDRGSILGQLYACEMPPANYAVPITSDQRITFMAWIECGAPNN